MLICTFIMHPCWALATPNPETWWGFHIYLYHTQCIMLIQSTVNLVLYPPISIFPHGVKSVCYITECLAGIGDCQDSSVKIQEACRPDSSAIKINFLVTENWPKMKLKSVRILLKIIHLASGSHIWSFFAQIICWPKVKVGQLQVKSQI